MSKIVEVFGKEVDENGKSDCPKCVLSKKYLDNKGIKYQYKVIHKDITIEDLIKKLGFTPRQAPLIFIDNVYIGGYEDLVKVI